MSDQQTTTTTTLTAVAARCRTAIERYARQVRENLSSALVSPIRRPYMTILTLGVVFLIVGGIASLVTGGIGEAIHTVALGGVVWFAALLLAGEHRATDYRQPTHADENAENSTYSTPTTTEED
jgi:uncharacterized membrane protein YbhN (UPF0104 family)